MLDSSAIINLHQHCRRKPLRKALQRLAKQGRLKIPEGVTREITRRTDDARKTIESLKKSGGQCIVMIASVHTLRSELTRIEHTYGQRIEFGTRQYPGFWSSPSGRIAADGQVVATARKLEGTVV